MRPGIAATAGSGGGEEVLVPASAVTATAAGPGGGGEMLVPASAVVAAAAGSGGGEGEGFVTASATQRLTTTVDVEPVDPLSGEGIVCVGPSVLRLLALAPEMGFRGAGGLSPG